MCHMRDMEYGVRVHLVCDCDWLGIRRNVKCMYAVALTIRLSQRVENQACRAKQLILVHISLVVLGIVDTN